MLSEKEALLTLSVCVLAPALEEALQQLSHTLIYKQEVKNACNKTYKVLQPLVNKCLESLHSSSPEETEALFNMKVDLVKNLILVHPEHYQLIGYAAKWINDEESYYFNALKTMALQYNAQLNKTA